jgi:hypothetical protein
MNYPFQNMNHLALYKKTVRLKKAASVNQQYFIHFNLHILKGNSKKTSILPLLEWDSYER